MGAAYNSQERSPPPRCHPGTRKEVLEKIDAWVNSGAQDRRVLWLHGPAGAGKSAIAQTVAETCAGRNQLAASFFFARTAANRNTVKHLFPTIAVQIALSAPEKRQRLNEILSHDPYIAERALGSIGLVASLLEDPSALGPPPFLVIIDGLDECQRNDDQSWILAQISRIVRTRHLPLRFLIVSRPESHIREAFEEPEPAAITQVLSLYGDYQDLSDVDKYLRSELSRIYGAKRHRGVMESVPSPWPSEDIIQRLVRQSEGYFIYASTVIKFVDEEFFSPAARLDQVLSKSDSSVFHSELNPFAELDQLYIQILSSSPTSQLPTLKLVLGSVIVSSFVDPQIFYRTSMRDLFPRGEMKLTLRGLRSLVSFVSFELGEWFPAYTLVHASFGDFLLDKARAKDYHIDIEEWTYTVFYHAFFLRCRALCRSLKPHNCASKPLNGRFLLYSIGLKLDQCANPRRLPTRLPPWGFVTIYRVFLRVQFQKGLAHKSCS